MQQVLVLMAISTYTELRTAVQNWINFTAVTDRIPEFITLAEAQMNRRLRVKQMVVRSEATLSAEFTDAPDDFLQPMQLTLEISESDIRFLKYLAPERLLHEKACMGAVSGEPIYYSHVGSEIQLLPTPSQSYTAELTYYGKIPALADNNTNWLLDDYPDAYLYGACLQAAPFLIEDERVATWGGLFSAIMDDIQKSNRVPGGQLKSELALLLGGNSYVDISSSRF